MYDYQAGKREGINDYHRESEIDRSRIFTRRGGGLCRTTGKGTYSMTQLSATRFDRKSIMLYAFPPEFIIGDVGTPENTKLSAGDKKFIAKMYPKE